MNRATPMRTSPRLLVSLALAAALLPGPRAALAQDAAAAEALFQQGRSLLAEGRTSEACQRFAQSQQIEPKLGTLMNLASCHETMGLTASAWAEFNSALAIAQREGQQDRVDFASERIAALRDRLSTLTIEVTAPAAGVEVTLDGRAYPVTGAPLPIDPGDHRIEARAPGKQAWSSSVRIAGDRQAARVVVPVLAADPAAGASPPTPAPAAAEVAPVPSDAGGPAPADGGGVGAVAVVGLVVGGTGLLVGGIAGAATLGMSGDVVDACGDDGICPRSQESDLDTARTLADVSTVGFIVGGVGVGVGLTALLIDLASGDGGAARARSPIEPLVGPGSLGARGRF
jgi:hypothetical protein